MSEKPTSQFEDITPALAAQYLENNRANRPFSKPWAHSLAKMMLRGEWRSTHQGIAFDKDGNLIDGQHRLKAIVLSGVTVRIMVTRGCAPEDFSVLDRGRNRSLRDVLGLPKAHTDAASFLTWFASNTTTGNAITASRAQAVYAVFKDAIDAVSMSNQVSAPVRAGAALRWHFGDNVSREWVISAVHAVSVSDHKFLSEHEAVSSLWRAVTGRRYHAKRLSRSDLFILAWNTFDLKESHRKRVYVNDAQMHAEKLREIILGAWPAGLKTNI